MEKYGVCDKCNGRGKITEMRKLAVMKDGKETWIDKKVSTCCPKCNNEPQDKTMILLSGKDPG